MVYSNKIVRMLSYTDLLRISFVDVVDDDDDVVDATVYNLFTVEQVMAKKLVAISPETTIKGTSEILLKKKFHALPVCLGELLVGITTTTDLIKYLRDTSINRKLKSPESGLFNFRKKSVSLNRQ